MLIYTEWATKTDTSDYAVYTARIHVAIQYFNPCFSIHKMKPKPDKCVIKILNRNITV